MRLLKGSLHPLDWELYVGPWMGRLVISRQGSFGWQEGDGPITRFVRRWWSGWHRWGDEL